MKRYSVKEMFYTLQGEGMHAGRASVFIRLSGCNLWSGRERDRAAAVCNFCDTDFVGGRRMSAAEIAEAARGLSAACDFIVLTGGEPLLQVDAPLCEALHAAGFVLALETNGTLPCPAEIDHICVSPKGTAPLQQLSGDELKLVYPQADAPPERFAGLDFRRFYLQPRADPDGTDHTPACIAYALAHPQWRLSLQTHKILGIT